MDSTKEQQVCIRFGENLTKSVMKTMAVIRHAFREESMGHTGAFEWHARFRAGQTFIEDDRHTGRPISSTTPDTVANLRQLVCKNRCQTIQDLADEIGIGYGAS
jgi:hypothetical protein